MSAQRAHPPTHRCTSAHACRCLDAHALDHPASGIVLHPQGLTTAPAPALVPLPGCNTAAATLAAAKALSRGLVAAPHHTTSAPCAPSPHLVAGAKLAVGDAKTSRAIVPGCLRQRALRFISCALPEGGGGRAQHCVFWTVLLGKRFLTKATPPGFLFYFFSGYFFPGYFFSGQLISFFDFWQSGNAPSGTSKK